MSTSRPFVLSIAGFDPSGGAGILADCKTFEANKVYGLALPTANTLQTEMSFSWIQWQKKEMLLESLRLFLNQFTIQAVKIGIIQNLSTLREVVLIIKKHNPKIQIIWDPVLKSSTHFDFIEQFQTSDLISFLKNIDLITPNYDEINLLMPDTINPLEKATLLSQYTRVLLKGGHNINALGHDYLIIQKKTTILVPKKCSEFAKHGSGCVLSSAITAFLAKGYSYTESCTKAKRFIENFLESNPSLLGYYEL